MEGVSCSLEEENCVQTTTLDIVLKGRQVTLMKVDVEGHEPAALEVNPPLLPQPSSFLCLH